MSMQLSRWQRAARLLLAIACADCAAAEVKEQPVTREELLAGVYLFTGRGPDPASAPAPSVEVKARVDAGDHERWHLRYLVDRDEYGYAYLLIPKSRRPGERLPLVLCPHPTSDIGKDRVVGIYATPPADDRERRERAARAYAIDLVRRGFVTFAPDRAAYGERRLLPEGGFQPQMAAYSEYLQGRYPGWKLTAGKNVWDLQRALDFLVTYEFIDPDRVGTIGHSLGAWDSMMLVGMDERVKVAVMNSGGMMHYVPELWEDTAALRRFVTDRSAQELKKTAALHLMLAAPRPLLYLYSLQDGFERGRPQLIEGMRAVTEYYRRASGTTKLPARADFSFLLHGYGHDFPPEAQALAYTWLEERLKPSAR